MYRILQEMSTIILVFLIISLMNETISTHHSSSISIVLIIVAGLPAITTLSG